MATLIGNGSHARDILGKSWDGGEFQSRYNHHKFWDGTPDLITIGINDPRLRAQVAEEMGVIDEPWIHPDAFFGIECSVDSGTHINYGVTMTRTTIGHHCTISPGVTICGDVTIGDRCLIGAGATICDRVTIGNDVTVGAGAVVLPETQVPDGETWVGVPAKSIYHDPWDDAPRVFTDAETYLAHYGDSELTRWVHDLYGGDYWAWREQHPRRV